MDKKPQAQRVKPRLYDRDYLTSIPMLDVLRDYGISVSRYGKFKLRDERTASAKYYEKKNNFFDFGIHAGGSNIDLVMALEGCDAKTAMRLLGERYGAPTIEDRPGDKGLTIAQYDKVGIYGEKASMNWEFDLSIPEEKLRALSNSLSMSMNELWRRLPMTYAKIIKTHAIPYVKESVEAYAEYVRLCATSKDCRKSIWEQYYRQRVGEEYGLVKEQYQILERCAKGTSLSVSALSPKRPDTLWPAKNNHNR